MIPAINRYEEIQLGVTEVSEASMLFGVKVDLVMWRPAGVVSRQDGERI